MASRRSLFSSCRRRHSRTSWRHVTDHDGSWRLVTAHDGSWQLIPFNRASNGLKWKRKILSVHRDQEIYWRIMDELLVKARLPEIFFFRCFYQTTGFWLSTFRSIALEMVSNGREKFCLSTETKKSIGEAWTSYCWTLDCQKSFFIQCFYQTTCFWLSTFRSIALEMVSNGRGIKKSRNLRDQEIYWRSMYEARDGTWRQMTANDGKWRQMTANNGKWRQMTANNGKWRQMTAHTVQSR